MPLLNRSLASSGVSGKISNSDRVSAATLFSAPNLSGAGFHDRSFATTVRQVVASSLAVASRDVELYAWFAAEVRSGNSFSLGFA
jgi:hypothetical protein